MSGTPTLALAVFLLTYLGMALGRVPGLKIDRTGIALIALVVLLASGAMTIEQMGRSIDAPTLLLLFALMIVSAQFAACGFYDECVRRITATQGGARRLLALTVAVAGAVSAVLANDIVVFAMTPLLCAGTRTRGLDPRPFLIALAGAANAGSAATVIGNPQNILIGQVGGLDFWRFLAACGPPAAISLAVVYGVVAWTWRDALSVPTQPGKAGLGRDLDRWQTGKGLVAIMALIALFATPLSREIAALAVAGWLLASRSVASRAMIAAVDWHLLLLFTCLFTVTGAFEQHGFAAALFQRLTDTGLLPDRLMVLAPLALAASNTIGNVPAVMLLLSIWPAPGASALHALALLSTLAGNLLLVGSLANLIVVERAAQAGVRLGFLDHARSGVPMTLLTMAVSILWLGLTGVLAWR